VDVVAAIEARVGGRLGVAVTDAAGTPIASHRGDERFALCSTFKLLAAGLTLREFDAGRWSPDERVSFTASDLISHCPFSTQRLATGSMSLLELAEGAQTTSDNLCANLLIARLGGPSGVTAHLRALGDIETRLDRTELELNFVPPGDVRDTTTPVAMARSTAGFVVGDWLSSASRSLLQRWMIETQTGLLRLRARLPPNWRAGDKTGSASAPGMLPKTNDVAVIWPDLARRGQAHAARRDAEDVIVVAGHYEGSPPATGEGVSDPHVVGEQVLAEVGEALAEALVRGDDPRA
jgi:beta-lactamase class A